MAEPGVLRGVAYRRSGAGMPLVLVHGVGMSSGYWAPQLAHFAPRWDVVAYDMLGHGGSRLPAADVRLADYAAQLHDVMDGLELERAVIVGHSMGALVALEYALAHPDRVSRVVAMNAVYRRSAAQRASVEARAADLEGSRTEAGRRATLGRWFGDPLPPALDAIAAWVDGALSSVDPAGYARTYRLFATSDTAHAGRLGLLQMPALFLTGELDANSSPAMSVAMAQEAPQGRVCILPGERHMMSLASPGIVNAALTQFIEPADLGRNGE